MRDGTNELDIPRAVEDEVEQPLPHHARAPHRDLDHAAPSPAALSEALQRVDLP